MKLTTTTQVSVDGVMQGPGAPDEVDSRAFPKGVGAQIYRPVGRPQYAAATAEPTP
jgi:hypothetical protein